MTATALDPSLARRLDLLRESGVIDAETRRLTSWAAALAEDLTGCRLVEDNAAFLVTHVAMAIQRARHGEQFEPPDVPVNDRDLLAEAIGPAGEVVDGLSREGVHLPEYERVLIALHLTALNEAERTNVPD